MGAEDLTAFEKRLLAWIASSDFEKVPWSTHRAAKAFEVDEAEVYQALSALTEKVPHNIYIHYKDGAIRIVADAV